MTTALIYIPQLIETVEQAEALPIGTVSMTNDPRDMPAIKVDEAFWVRVWEVSEGYETVCDIDPNTHMVGSTALVPVEVERTPNV